MDRSRRLSTLAAIVVLVIVAAGAVLLGTRDRAPGSATELSRPQPAGAETTYSTAAPEPDPRTVRAARAQDALRDLEAALATGDLRTWRSGFVRGARGEATQTFRTLRALPLDTWDLRYASEDDAGPRGWTGRVRATWSLAGFDAREVSTDLEVGFVLAGEEARLRGVSAHPQGRLPEWLLGPVEVRRSPTTLVISARPEFTEQIAAQARRAVRDVRAVVHGNHSGVVVVVPGDVRTLAAYLDGEPSRYGSIAAVTTTADGLADVASPVRIAVNPAVYPGLGDAGAQVVLSHEATHAATGAAMTRAPLWLVEGFADYVALADGTVPLEVAGSQILDRVRRDGAPRRLPGDADFGHHKHQLGATYEAAWLVCRMIAEEYGEQRLLRLYEQALTDNDVQPALRQVLGIGVPELTRQWRDYLERLA